MKRFARVALVVGLGIAAMALPVCAQRGGSRGGFAGGSRTGFRGGAAPAAHYDFSGVRAFSASRPLVIPALRGSGPGYRPRPVSPGYGGYRGGSRPARAYGFAIPYGYPVDGYLDAGDLADSEIGDGSAPAAGYYAPGDASSGYDPQVASGYDAQGGAMYGPQAPAGWQPSADQNAAPVPARRAAAPLPEEDSVTLIFKDGRAPMQIHNYALTRTTLYVRDQHSRDIPVEQLDLAATEKVNRNAGVEFQLPAALR